MKSTQATTRGTARTYRMTKRAQLVDQTKREITAATARLHTTVGPANTTIAGIAEEAGVTRLTVYRHFPDLDALFEACRAHWRAENPPPDASTWPTIPRFDDRARRAFGDLYRWFAEHVTELTPIYRDMDVSPASSRAHMQSENQRLGELLLVGMAPPGRQGREARALARHLLDFRTWRSLTVDQGLSPSDVVNLATRALASSVAAN